MLTMLTLLGLCGAVTGVSAQTSAPLPPAAPSPQPAMLGPMPWQSAIVLPGMPHEATPDARPYPEYVAEALKLTQLATDDSVKAVRLHAANGERHRYLVLPIQTEAFGFTPAFRALVAAHLDHELARRGIDGNRQTDVLDAYGPFVRRLDDATWGALSKQNPSSALVGLYLGHDGADKAFLTLVLREGDRTQRARRDLPLPAKPREAAMALAALLPSLLDELRLGAAPAPASTVATDDTCKEQTWQLIRATNSADGVPLACHAIVVGTLLPEFEDSRSYFPSSYTPAKLAWLATAYVEAERRAAATATSKSIQDIAWSQLQLDDAAGPVLNHTQSSDPVVSRLAKLLTSRQRSGTSPVRSGREATERYVEDAAQGLPDFARAAFIERGNYGDAFRRVDLCAIERKLPGMMLSAKCRSDEAPAPPKPGRATDGETALYQEWRLAAYQKDIRYFGTTVGQHERLAQLLGALPGDVARHPFIRQERFKVEELGVSEGSFDAYLARVRAAAAAFVQSTADAQRYDATLAGYSIAEHTWVKNTNVLNDKAISQLSDDEARLSAVLKFDRFASTVFPATRRVSGSPATFLFSGSVRMAEMQAMMQPAIRAASAPQVSPPASMPRPTALAPTRPLFVRPDHPQAPLVTDAQLQARIAEHPTDMDSRVALAMQMLGRGRPEAEARSVIDAYPRNMRTDAQVGESHTWATPAHAFFFAGDMGNAKLYYQRVRDIGTGSGSDLQARMRLRQIDGDLSGALVAADVRLRRYEGDFARRDLAGLLFMTGRPEQAWLLLTPRLASASTFQLWVGALVGQRIDHLDLPAVKAWIDRQGLGQAQINYQDSAAAYLHLYGVTDRLPTDADIALLQGSSASAYRSGRWVASARLMQMTLQDSYTKEAFESTRALLAQSASEDTSFMRPLFAWVAWHATAGKEPELDAIRNTSQQTSNFDALLAKSMLLALEGQPDLSLEFLRAARYQMSDLGAGSANIDRAVPSAYQYALAGYLMYRKTGKEEYRVEALRFALAHQRIFPFWGWSYALEALLEHDDKSRAVALCRAKYLDPSSYFLSQMKPGAGSRPAACAKALWPSQPMSTRNAPSTVAG